MEEESEEVVGDFVLEKGQAWPNVALFVQNGFKELKLLCFLRRKQNILYLCTRVNEVKKI